MRCGSWVATIRDAELADLRVRVREQRQDLVVAGLRTARAAERAPRSRRPGRGASRCGSAGAAGRRATRRDASTRSCTARKRSSSSSSSSAWSAIDATRGDGVASAIAKAFRRTGARGVGGHRLRDPGQRALVRVLAQVVERRVHDDRIGVPEKALQALEEAAARERLEALHRLAADRLGLGREEREDRRRRGFVRKLLQRTTGRPGGARRRCRRRARPRRRPRGRAPPRSPSGARRARRRSSRRARAASRAARPDPELCV